MMKREECQSPIETILNPNLIEPKEEDTIPTHVPYIDTPQEAVIIGDDPRWRRNHCACEANQVGDGEIRVSRAPKRLKTLDEIRVCKSKPSSSNNASAEVGSFFCEICVEPKSVLDSFGIKNCSHAYCSDCVVSYVSSKLQDNVTTIGCPVPDCRGSLEPEHCLSILPPELFLLWGKALCEAVFVDSDEYFRIFYCPFKDCSAMLIEDGVEEVDLVRESECPHCWRLFCARCRVPWHADIDCEEFQELNKDERRKEDFMLIQLAKDKKWRRCPKCRFYVERSEGCKFMKCRCRTAFCYRCGRILSKNHGHFCPSCDSVRLDI